MAPSTRGMNGLFRGMAAALLLFALLLCTEVKSQESSTISDGGSPAPASASAGMSQQAVTGQDQSLAPSAPQQMTNEPNGQIVDATKPSQNADVEFKCIAKEDIPNFNPKLSFQVEVADCESIKKTFEETLRASCPDPDTCEIQLYYENNTIQLFVPNKVSLGNVVDEVMQNKDLKEKLGVSNIESPSPSSTRSVFVGLLVTGLLAAVAITVGYFKCQRRPSAAKGAQLAEEGSPVSQENQGSTLASVAPLNPPPETQEKPNMNGESPEGDKTQTPPPTNGHSNAKTADTEL